MLWSLLTGNPSSWPAVDFAGSQQAILQAQDKFASPHAVHALNSSEDGDVVPYAFEASLVPLIAVALSFAWIVVLGLVYGVGRLWKTFKNREYTGLEHAEVEEGDEQAEKPSHIESLGGLVIFLFRVARLLGCIALFSLSTNTLLRNKNLRAPLDLKANLFRIGLTGTYAYSIALGLATVVTEPVRARRSVRHLNFVLFAALLALSYRDLWPLATFTFRPVDTDSTSWLWTEIATLTFANVIVPLFVPSQYIPYDPKEPAPEPNPEQVASIWSLMMHSYLDSIIFLANRVPHLTIDQLPPLSDYDRTKNLVSRSFKELDPFLVGRKRHLFFGLMTVFRWEYVTLAIMILIRVFTAFASPLGINRLLNYMETGGKDAIVRPWFWILWLLLGPVLGAIAVQWYIFVATGMMVRCQGMLTQLLFDHALRIRVKAEANKDVSPSANSSAAPSPTPDSASVADSPVDDNGSDAAESVRSESAAAKGKQREPSAVSASSTSTKVEKEKDDDAKKEANLAGKMNNLATTDMEALVNGRDFMFVLIYIPVQLVFCVIFLYQILGWSSFVGLAATALMFPVPGIIASFIQKTQINKMKKTDARVQSVTEIMNVIRMIKLFGWEPKVNDQIAEKREEELVYIRRFKLLELANGVTNFFLPCITMVVTYSLYTLVMKQQLTASVVFSSMVVFDLLRDQLHTIFGMLPDLIQAKVSLDRVNDFLHETELLDSFTKKTDDQWDMTAAVPDPNVIGFRDAAFTWTSENNGTWTPGSTRRSFTLRIDDELTFKRGHINLIVGATGTGKTSLLMALLGEMHYLPSGPNSYFHLPRAGGVAYASQESWVQNETIRENIIFGAPFDEERYHKVIEQCGLKRDLTLFDAGDQTEVGEKGLTLSGGQKARITLARAVYSKAEILLLDDVLAALDVHTAKWIVEKCFQGDLIRGRTVLLVTHNVAMTSSIAEFIVSMGNNGQILSQGSLSKALAKDKKLSKELKEEAKQIEKIEHEVDAVEPAEGNKKTDGKLIVAEEIEEGHVGWPALKMWFGTMGGDHAWVYWSFFIGAMIITPVVEVSLTWYLGYWAHQYEDHDPSEVSAPYYLTVYSVLTVLVVILYLLGYVVYVYGCLRASRAIHKKLVATVTGTTLRWLDTTPISRVITRCTQDIQAVDGPIGQYFAWVVELSTYMAIKLSAAVIIAPIFILPGVVVAVLGGICGQIYMKGQLSVKREMSNARAPVLSHFGAAMAGLISIRAYSAQDAFKQRSFERIDRFTSAARTFYNLNRWVCIRIEFLGGAFAALAAAWLVYGTSVDASNTGFAIGQAVGFSSMILWWIRLLNQFEVSGNSLERIQQYLEIEQEPKPTKEGEPPAYWPASGNLAVEKLSAKYSLDGPQVLKDVSFSVSSGERVGIVGRTGSGKSSLTLSLLRCIFTEGSVRYDGLETSKINLDALRSSITIIPQVPELLSGSLRHNLDPFDQYDDATLNDALRAAGLFSLQKDEDDGRITLDSPISSGGGNLSVGQRQILALARAIVRRSKLLILDEATSAIDYETDTVIQSSLRKELDKDVTLLTVAHRLQTIMDADKIMVLDAGQIVEFGKPFELLQNEKGVLRSLVDESGDKENLYAMAKNHASE